MFTKVKMCTYGTIHTSNGYYYAVMAMRTIFYPILGREKTIEAYYKRFETYISTDDLAKWNDTTHVELNKTYTGGLMKTVIRGSKNVTHNVCWLWIILRDLEWSEENHPSGYRQVIKNHNWYILCAVSLHETNTTMTSTRATSRSHVRPTCW